MAAKDIEPHKFKKGQSGKPNGRPPKLPDLHILLANVLGKENKDGLTAAEEILLALHAKAKKGDTRAAELLLDRGYGKPKQTHAVGDSIWIRLPNTESTHAKVVVVEVLDDDLYHVSRHVPGGDRQHFAVTPDEIMPF